MVISVAKSLVKGVMPRLRISSSASTTKPAAPMPTIMPFLLLSKGRAALVTSDSRLTAPEAKKPAKIHSWITLLVTSSAAMMMTLFALPSLIQSSATLIACAVEAHAPLKCVAGPRALIHWQNWLWAIGMALSKKSWENTLALWCSYSANFSSNQALIWALRDSSLMLFIICS